MRSVASGLGMMWAEVRGVSGVSAMRPSRVRQPPRPVPSRGTRAGAPTPVELKRDELEQCDDALHATRAQLDDAAERTRAFPADRELDDLQPLSLEIARLRRR